MENIEKNNNSRWSKCLRPVQIKKMSDMEQKMEQAAIDFATFQKFQAVISPSLYLALDSAVLR